MLVCPSHNEIAVEQNASIDDNLSSGTLHTRIMILTNLASFLNII